MGGESSAWLSDLQREMGVERFSRFWHSELPVAEAFQQAFGMGLGAWNRRWLTRTYSGIHPGPLPRSRSVAYAGGVMLLLFGLAAAVACGKSADRLDLQRQVGRHDAVGEGTHRDEIGTS
jgi:hypothetical protein